MIFNAKPLQTFKAIFQSTQIENLHTCYYTNWHKLPFSTTITKTV